MPRFYNDRMRPSANKAVSPGKEKKVGKPPAAAPGKGEGTTPGGSGDGQERPASAE